jgi:hypothetical protein
MPGVKFDWKLNAPSALYTFLSAAAGILVAFMMLQSKVDSIVSRIGNMEARIDKVETAREVDRLQRQTDRDAFLRMEGDLRVIRQIVEGLKPQGPAR